MSLSAGADNRVLAHVLYAHAGLLKLITLQFLNDAGCSTLEHAQPIWMAVRGGMIP